MWNNVFGMFKKTNESWELNEEAILLNEGIVTDIKNRVKKSFE